MNSATAIQHHEACRTGAKRDLSDWSTTGRMAVLAPITAQMINDQLNALVRLCVLVPMLLSQLCLAIQVMSSISCQFPFPCRSLPNPPGYSPNGKPVIPYRLKQDSLVSDFCMLARPHVSSKIRNYWIKIDEGAAKCGPTLEKQEGSTWLP